MFDFMRIGRVALGLTLLTAAGASLAAAEVSIASTDTTVTMVNGTVNAQFRVAATNSDGADATNVHVVLPDGSAVVIGDVPSGATVTSGPEFRSYDASQTPTKSQTLPVTLKFTLGAQAIEQPAMLVLTVQD